MTGTVGSPAITVTGGRVWMVVGVDGGLVVEQLDTSTLTLHSRQDFPVKNDVFGLEEADPVLAATVNGPLWVAGGEDLWAFNPTTGDLETEFDTGNLIVSMSTDPTGTLLYTGAEDSQSMPLVTEYSAKSGQEIKRVYPGGIISADVAATYGAVWVSFRTGMAGQAIELSADGLTQIAPPLNAQGSSLDTYGQDGGVDTSVSEGTVWVTALTGNGSLACADPRTGVVRATETVQVQGPIASGSLLYAFSRRRPRDDKATCKVLRLVRPGAKSLAATLRGDRTIAPVR